jgi:hypothetical protein
MIDILKNFIERNKNNPKYEKEIKDAIAKIKKLSEIIN